MSANHAHKRESNIALVFFINLTFTIIEIAGGILTNSIAIISNAIHDSGDVVALGFSWYLERVAKRKKDRIFSFGYKRFSLLAALINGVVLLSGTVIILIHAVPRLFFQEPVHVEGMIGLAILGVLVNGLAALRLSKGHSMNENILSLHLIEDVLGWVAVLAVAVAMHFVDWPILDPILSIVFTVIILWNAFRRLKKTLLIFLQSIPDDINLALLEETIGSFECVAGLHDTRVWSLDGEHHVLSTHVVVVSDATAKQIEALKSQIRIKLLDFEIQHATIEVDILGDSCELKD